MKKIITLLLLVFTVPAFAQNYPITGIIISLPANPDANIANWGTSTSQLTITAVAKADNGRVDGHVQESKVLVIIKKGGAKVCGSYTSSSAPSSNFNTVTKVWSGSNAASLIGQVCTLPPGDYELSVQFFSYGAAVRALSDEKTKAFTIRGNEQQVYQAPQAVAPANGTALSEPDIPKPITFRWTPVVPRPQEPVSYRLRVWQLMQGQNGTQAMKTNQPIVTKDVDNITQAVVTGIITGPCKPPYLCDFAWNVQALNREGKPIGSNNGTSETFAFRFNTVKEETNSPIKLRTPANGSTITPGETPRFTWLPPMPTPPGRVSYKIKIVEIKGDQSPEEALHTNKPFFEKDSLKEPSVQYPPSAPAFKLKQEYAWSVVANNQEGNAVKDNEGGDTFVFKMMGNYSINIQNLTVGCPNANSYNFTVNVGNPNNTTAIFDKLEVVNVNGSVITPINIAPTTPGIGSLISGNGNINIAGTFSYSLPITTVGIKAYIKEQAHPSLNTASSYTLDTLHCCVPCDLNKVEASNSSISIINGAVGTVKIVNTLSASPNNITKIVADLVCVKVLSNNNSCDKCNKLKKQQDQFVGNNTIVSGSQWKNNGKGAISNNSINNITRTLTFKSTGAQGVNIASGIQINQIVGLPPVSCCGDKVEVWIRYSVWDKDCHVCQKLVQATLTRDNACSTVIDHEVEYKDADEKIDSKK